MKRDTLIARHSAADLLAMVERGDSRSDWDAVKALTDAELEAAIAGDPDEAGTAIDWSRAILHPDSRKKTMTMRADADVLAFFKDQARGYQTKINAVLRAYMDHTRK